MKTMERTSKRVASQAGAALRDPKASKREKTVAASALTQREVVAGGTMDILLNRIAAYCRQHRIRAEEAARIFNAGLEARRALSRSKK